MRIVSKHPVRTILATFNVLIAIIGEAHVFAAPLDQPRTTRAQIGSHIFDIPANYGSVSSGGIDTPGGAKAFTFTVLMPDFAPHTTENDLQFRKLGWHDQVHGLFEYVPGRKMLSPNDELSIFLKDPLIDASKWVVTPAQFRVYTPKVKTDADVRVKTLQDGRLLVMRCSQTGFVPYPSCKVLEQWGELTLIYGFALKYSDQADEIDRKIKAMMLSFQKT